MDIRSQLQGLRQVENTSAAERVQAVETRAAGPDTAASAIPGDETHLSSAAGWVSQALSLPDVRTDKVAQMQQALATGSYHVSASEVAGKLIDSMLER